MPCWGHQASDVTKQETDMICRYQVIFSHEDLNVYRLYCMVLALNYVIDFSCLNSGCQSYSGWFFLNGVKGICQSILLLCYSVHVHNSACEESEESCTAHDWDKWFVTRIRTITWFRRTATVLYVICSQANSQNNTMHAKMETCQLWKKKETLAAIAVYKCTYFNFLPA